MKKLICAVTILVVSTAQADTGAFQQPGVVPDTGPSGPGVLLVGSVAGTGLTFYDNEADFLAALPASKTNRGLETFEENNLPDGTAVFLNAPLCSGIANINFPDGLTGLDNVCVSSPDLAIATTGFAGVASDAVGEGGMTVGFPTVITFNQPPLPPGPFKTAVSLNLYSLGSGDVTVTVLDPAGNVLGSAIYLGAGTTPTFVGIIAGPVQAIASIEVDSSGGHELVDDISPWSGSDCFAVVTEVVNCHADGASFTYTVQGIDSCTGGMSTYSFTASGGAVGEEMCFTLLVNDGGFCCTTEICVTIPDCSPDFDLDGDGIVGMADFLALLAAWGSCSDCGTCPADFDGDCSVGNLDLLILLGNWG